LRGLSVNDHNSLKGGLETASFAKKNHLNLVIAPSEEVNTNAGDIIGLFLNEEVRERNVFEAIDLIKQQDGLVVLPHPFRQHDSRTIKEIAKRVDVIETINARTYFKKNAQAADLASKLRKPTSGGSDAHFVTEIGLARTVFKREIENEEELRKALKKGLGKPKLLGVNPLARLATQATKIFKHFL